MQEKSHILQAFNIRSTPYVIAEIGAKYDGIDTVKEMVRSAANCGADMVKFQTFKAETVSTPGSYFTFEDGSKVSQFDFFKEHELSGSDHDVLAALCDELNIAWTSTPSHPDDVDFLERYDLPFYKTGSDDLTNTPFLQYIAEKGSPMLVSTGMCTMEEISRAVETIKGTGNENIILLHCVVSYPSKPEDANSRVIETLQQTFDLPVGLSDHTQDEFTSILATQLGACVVEKHFTLDHAMKLPDHQASLDPQEFKLLVDRVKLVEKALGTGEKVILPTEEKWRKSARKSLFVIQDIPEGETIGQQHLTIRRPSTGLPPHYYQQVLGKKARRLIQSGEVLQLDDVI